jgi:predicted lipoprotein with Yx(FWY)xxD motif
MARLQGAGRKVVVLSIVVVAAMLMAGCRAPAGATPAPAAAPTAAPTQEPAATMPPVAEAATVSVGETTLGKILVGDKGMTLYMFTKDQNGESACYDNCAVAWPPLLVTGDPVAGEGVDAALLSVTTRTDGAKQVRYNGMPLYYYAKDMAAGDVIGQDVGQAWYVIAPDGKVIGAEMAAAPATAAPAAAPATVSVGETALGKILVDDKGLTLYMFTKDQNGESACYDKCAVAWPPLLVTGDPVAGEGVDASLLSVTTRTDGTKQVRYNGMPLYYYLEDVAAGDVIGQDIGQAWYVIAPSGEVIK